ncbi:MAG: hypothetical protein P8J87_18760, partial [Verrucomicrobiales bacterium]|nr:hypothetical protein [Verrucomicrobiales bacterium]
TTIDIEIPTSAVNTTDDFVQIVATLDTTAGRASLYARGSAGGSTSTSADGEIGSPNARASLFVWSGFGGGADGTLGGTADGVPLEITSFKGQIGLLNIYGRSLTVKETEETFARISDTQISEGDTDSDGLPDFWELAEFGNLDQIATGNTDGDTLTHAQELAAGTDPNLADSDADGLDDDVEIAAGFPTNPLDPDSDNDYLTDGEEVNGNPPSDPNSADTDFDFFWDVFEIDRGSNPDDFTSIPPADDIGTPFAAIHSPGAYDSLQALFAVDTFDASFRVSVDFSEKNTDPRELIFETGGGTIGTSLTYETGSELVLRSAGDGGFGLATVRHPLTPEQLAAGELDIVFTYDVEDEDFNSVITLFIDGSAVGSDTQLLGADWSGTNAATFGAASPDLAGSGENTPLNAAAPTSLTINHRHGLILYSEVLYTGGTTPAPTAPQITAFEFDPILRSVDLTWISQPGTSYRITGSNNLSGWSDELVDTVTATSASTSSSAPLPPTATSNYNVRVEVIAP